DCPHCADTVRAEFPAGVNAPVQYGSRFQALMVYLNQQQMLPYDRLAQLCQDLFGQPLSAGTLVAAVERVFAQLEPFARALVQQILQAPLCIWTRAACAWTGPCTGCTWLRPGS